MDDLALAERLNKQIQFILEIDKAKKVLRRSYLLDKSRNENDAEHSWHLAIMALVLCEYASASMDVTRVLKMALIHDLVEIDVGDIPIYDITEKGATEKREMERAAADRIFGLLPTEQEIEFRAIWEEFEAMETAEARFAKALDRFQPLLHNYHTRGGSWRELAVTADRVLSKNQPILAEGAPALERYATHMIEDAIEKGYFK